MRPISKINWIVLTLISFASLYVVLNTSGDFYEFMKTGARDESDDDNGNSKNGGHGNREHFQYFTRENDNPELKTRTRELLKLRKKAEQYDLWKGDPDSVWVNASDKVHNLAQWVTDLTKSSYLKTAKPKKILIFDGAGSYYGTNGHIKCPLTNETASLSQKCIVKEDKPFEVTTYAGYDAFVNVRNWKVVIFERRIPFVRHVYYIEESPYVAKYADLSINNAILASYWRGSDIVLPYGYFSKFETDRTNSHTHKIKRINYAQGKTKLAAIIVSNCEAKNDRLRYVEELQKFIPVHVYGDCGPYKCDDCFKTIQNEYKFYLAFEKANCRDYVTEKFWRNALGNDAVPVVLGAHPDDYKAVAPPNSFIQVEDFQSPRDLADYLIHLDKEDKQYNKYFEYKERGEIIYVWEQFFCRLCSLLFYGDFVQPRNWPQGASWASVNKCLPLKRWYWTRNN